MYNCSICGKPVEVDHINKPKCCEGATILAGLSGTAHGGGFMHVTVTNNNLSDASADITKQLFTYLIANEVFKNNKSHVFADNVSIHDTDTGRKFTCSINIKEC